MDYINIPERSKRGSSPITLYCKRYWKFITPIVIFFLFILKSTWGSFHHSNPNLDHILDSNPNASMKDQYNSIHTHNSIPTESPLRAQLAFNFPYNSRSPIPKTIFQTWKVEQDHPDFPKSFKGSVKSWSKRNPNHSYVLIPDHLLDEFIELEFSNVPLIIKAWHLLPKMILKADFFRYLIIFARGGVYSDTDTFCIKEIDKWALYQQEYKSEDDHFRKDLKFGSSDKNALSSIAESDPIEAQSNDIGLVLGIEADPDRSDWSEWYARRIQFIQWTLMGKRGHPLLRELIARIVEETLRRESMGTVNKIEGKDQGGDIMHWTGPGIFTDVVFDYMNNIVNKAYGSGYGIGSAHWISGKKWELKEQELTKYGMPLHESEMWINWTTFTGMKRPGIVDDIMVLPITGFSPGVGQMGSKPDTDPMAFVKHLFFGSWKLQEERMH